MKPVLASSIEAQFFLAGQRHLTPALNTVTYAVAIKGPLLPKNLAAAFQQVSLRHPILRTHFEAAAGSIVRIVDEAGPDEALAIREAPSSETALCDAVEGVRQALSPETRLWKALLLRHESDDHTLIFAAHRSIWDERSTTILSAELSQLYRSVPVQLPPACPAGGTDEAPVGTVQLSDSEAMTGARHLAASLLDVPALHGFPLRAPRPKLLSSAASSIEMGLDETTTSALLRAAEAWGVEPFVVQAAAAAYVLASYCGQPKLAIGMPFSSSDDGKDGAELGGRTATVPIGFSTEASSFTALVAALAQTCSSARPHANTPSHLLVRECAARTDPSANPLFQIAFAKDASLTLDLDRCVCHPRTVAAPPQQVDIFLQLAPTRLRIAYLSEIIDEASATSLGRSMAAFLGAALRAPQCPLEELPVLAESERRALLVDVNRTDEASFLSQDLYAVVTRHLTAANAKPALVCGPSTLSYADLLVAVESIANRLSQAGVGQGSLIGICLPRSPEMVAAMLAILRTGNAYVPLDPAFPRERLSYMVEHSRLSHIVTTGELRRLFDQPKVALIDLDDGARPAGKVPGPVAMPAAAVAYVIYTSGSTGKPKGVAVPRGAMANFLLSMQERPGIRPDDISCAVTTLSFDIAVLELLAPLCAGATVVIATEEEARDPRLLTALLTSHAVTLLQATPVTWQMLCLAGWSGDRGLTALCGGEALSPTLARALSSRVQALWNMYGPTETTVWSCCGQVTDANAAISVGTPIHNTAIYILDQHRRPVPPGVEGQLFIAGDGVALGYLHDEALTQQRFSLDPFRGRGRMYDTGDRARFDLQGRLYIVGRSDSQVKLRGFRIELGEIENRLSGFRGVGQVVVVVRRDDVENPELVAYYVLEPNQPEPTVTDLRQHCGGTLPAYMVPSRFVRLDALPLTPNGKVDRKVLPRPDGETASAARQTPSAMPRSDLERTLLDIWRRVLLSQTVGINDNFFDLGGTSLAAFSVAQEVARVLGVELPVLKIFEHPTIAALAQFLKGTQADSAWIRKVYQRAQLRRRAAASATAFDVAIVGAAGRFPGARNLEQLWDNLCAGRETVTIFSRDDLDPLVPATDRNDPNYVPARGVLEDIEMFDAAFFGINPNEAELMDPQLRVFLEVAWEAFENAGYVGEQIEGPVGVWAGMGNNFYYHHNVLTRPDRLAVMGEITAEIANEKDHIAPRVSHKLNLTGPSLSVHTACSTTLVVVENAYQALVTHQVDVALAGGVDIRTPQKSGQRFEEGGVFSNDGHCRPFDAAATGTMFGEGVGAVVLKRLDDAVRDNDTIYAIIKGAAVNHDGGHKVSYLAPSVEGQARVIASALAIGDVSPDTVTYVEAHGTATPIGDPIEVEALTRVFRTFTQRKNFCVLGSIKGNFGHATTAAGIAGILKVVMALRHRKIPATLHFATPNPHIDFARSPFWVSSELVDWQPRGGARRAAVSSFGFCGTNAHVVLEEAPSASSSSPPSRPVQLVLLSARSPKALDQAAGKVAEVLLRSTPEALADAAFTTQVGRKRFEHRRCAVLRSAEDALDALTRPTGPLSASLRSDVDNPSVAFMFPGQGAQYVNMGLRLYQSESAFRKTVDDCAAILQPRLGCDLRAFLYPDPADAATATESLNNTFYTQPAIFTISYALASLLMQWGIQPSAFIGHSIGEFVAATLAGVMSLEDALRLVAARGALMRDLPRGSMLSVRLPFERIAARLPRGLDLAAANSPQLCVIAGPTDLLQKLSDELSAEGTICRMLHTSHAFHSSMMDPVVEPFLQEVQKVHLSAPRIPFVSTVTGEWVHPQQATSPAYWAGHLRSPVQFSKAIQVLLEDSQQVIVECGPRRTGISLAHQHRPVHPGRLIGCMPDSANSDDELTSILLAVGALWLNGCNVNWSALHGHDTRRRIALPGYAFQRQRYWLDPGNAPSYGLDGPAVSRPTAAAPDLVGSLGDAPGDGSATDAVMAALVGVMEESLGAKLESFAPEAPFISLGFDSLLVTQLARTIRLRLGFPVTFRQLTDQYTTPKLLADAMRSGRPRDARAPVAGPCDRAPATSASPAVAAASTASSTQVPALPAPALTGRSSGVRLGRDAQGRPAWFFSDMTGAGGVRELRLVADGATAGGPIAHDPFALPAVATLPATQAQRDMWLSAQSGPDATRAYNESFWVKLDGSVDHGALSQALQGLVDIHEALRGHLGSDGEKFVIEPSYTLPVAQHDLSSLSAAEREAALERLQALDAETPYDLEKLGLFRAAVIKMDAHQCMVMLSAHGAVCDGWSLDVALFDLGRLYSTFAGRAPLPALPKHSFSDYVAYCQSDEFRARADASRGFWKRALSDLPPALSVPFDGHRPAHRSYGARHALHPTSDDLLELVKSFSRAHNVSLVSVLLSSFAVLLHRLSGADDLLIGIPVAGHPDVGMEDCVGRLVNLMPIRCRFQPKLLFVDLCKATQSAMLDARENASVSFGEIVSTIGVPLKPGEAPLLSAVFTHAQRYAPGKLVFADCAVDYHLNRRSFETFEFNINAIETLSSLHFKSHGNADLCGPDWLDWRLRELECLVRHGCQSPEAAVDLLEYLPDREKQIVEAHRNPVRKAPAVDDLVVRVREHAERAPEHVAVRVGPSAIGYRQLNAAVGRLSDILTGGGVSAGMSVGICLDRSADLLVAALAVSNAGGCYVLLDPDFPEARLASIARDSGLRLIISKAALGSRCGCPERQILDLDAEPPALRGPVTAMSMSMSMSMSMPTPHPGLAFVSYVSDGSAREPRGVLTLRESVASFLVGAQQHVGLGAEDRVVVARESLLENGLLEMLLPLSVGAEVIVPGADEIVDGWALRALLEKSQATAMIAHPHVWRLLIESEWKGRQGFKAMCDGELLSRDLTTALLARVDVLWAMYGTPETTMWCSCARVVDPEPDRSTAQAMGNTCFRILDKAGRDCPIGVPGEIAIGGDMVTPGHVNRPALDRELFIPDPSGSATGPRICRTGYRGSWLDNGSIKHLGGKSGQADISGHRFELGEIATVLAEAAGVQRAAVAVHADALGEDRIVGYVAFKAGGVQSCSDLRRHLASRLPGYMLPHVLMEFDSLADSQGAGFERRVLPSPYAEPTSGGQADGEPRTDVERAIAAIWCELLGLERVSTHDNFFALGGHSLLSARMAAELLRRKGYRLSVRSVVFETLEQLAGNCVRGS